MTQLKLKRAYEPESAADGYRIYIDRLWPQGLSHETFHYDLWDKDIAPSTQLREWYHADPENRWEAFVEKYTIELKGNPAYAQLRSLVISKPIVTLLYSSRNEVHNNAVVVYNLLDKEL